MNIAETDRLIHREFDLSDGEAMDHVFSDPEVMRFGPGVRSPKWVREWLGRCMKTYEERGFGLGRSSSKKVKFMR